MQCAVSQFQVGRKMVALGWSSLLFVQSAVALSSTPPRPMDRILVTGANQGIGLALTKQLVADHGCYVYLGARDAARGAEAVEEVKATAGTSVELVTVDVGNDASVRQAASELSRQLGGEKLYAVVNNAGAGFSQHPSEILDTNTRGPRRVVDNFLPLIDDSRGRIVNVGSGGGPRFFEALRSDFDKQRYLFGLTEEEIEAEILKIEATGNSYEAYRGSKALLACYTMDLAEKHPNLMISVLTPGWIKTRMTAESGASKEPHEGTVALKKCLFEDLPGSGYFWGSDGKRSPLHFMRNPGEPEYDGTLPSFALNSPRITPLAG